MRCAASSAACRSLPMSPGSVGTSLPGTTPLRRSSGTSAGSHPRSATSCTGCSPTRLPRRCLLRPGPRRHGAWCLCSVRRTTFGPATRHSSPRGTNTRKWSGVRRLVVRARGRCTGIRYQALATSNVWRRALRICKFPANDDPGAQARTLHPVLRNLDQLSCQSLQPLTTLHGDTGWPRAERRPRHQAGQARRTDDAPACPASLHTAATLFP